MGLIKGLPLGTKIGQGCLDGAEAQEQCGPSVSEASKCPSLEKETV